MAVSGCLLLLNYIKKYKKEKVKRAATKITPETDLEGKGLLQETSFDTRSIVKE